MWMCVWERMSVWSVIVVTTCIASHQPEYRSQVWCFSHSFLLLVIHMMCPNNLFSRPHHHHLPYFLHDDDMGAHEYLRKKSHLSFIFMDRKPYIPRSPHPSLSLLISHAVPSDCLSPTFRTAVSYARSFSPASQVRARQQRIVGDQRLWPGTSNQRKRRRKDREIA